MIINPRLALVFLSLTGIILIGSLTIYSVTSIDIYYFLRFLTINFFAVILVTFFFYQINLNRILSFGWLMFLGNILLVLSVEIIGKEVNGAQRWIDLGFLSIQPTEFMKIAYPLFAIQYLRFYNFQFNLFRALFLLATLFLSAIPIIIQPDLGTGIVYIL